MVRGDGQSENVLTAADVIYCYRKWEKNFSDLVYVLTGRKGTDECVYIKLVEREKYMKCHMAGLF
jgi:hypothetical protein